MATKKEKEVKEAIESANEYVNSDLNKEIDGLIDIIRASKYKDVKGAITGIMQTQVSILELMKK